MTKEIENQRIKEIEEIASGLDKEAVRKAKFVDTFLSAKDVAFLSTASLLMMWTRRLGGQ